MRNKLTWLHISDIHFYPKTEWRDSVCRSALLDHLKNIFAQNDSIRPDFIFCTGDIAFGESSSMPLQNQYLQAKAFFDDLLKTCGEAGMPLPKERLFVVPGNHDVNRNSINTDAQGTLTSWASHASTHIETINQRVNDRTKEFKDAIKRLDEYAQFVKDYLPHQYDAEGRQHYTKISNIDGLKVGIAGFNSAWTCAGTEDDRNIWLAAEWQFNTVQQTLADADVRIGLIHHPIDWLNLADRDIATHRIASDFDFWLHGHSHNAWITPIQSHIVVAAGAIGAKNSEEFGINLSSVDLVAMKGMVHLHNKRAGSNGWTIAPVDHHAPSGKWVFDLPARLQGKVRSISPPFSNQEVSMPAKQDHLVRDSFVDNYLTKKLEDALQSFSSQPKVWVTPILSKKSEIAGDAKSEPRINLSNIIENPKSIKIKAPPQHGQTCLAHYLIREAWRTQTKCSWLYLDSKELKPHAASISKAISDEVANLGCSEEDIKCVILDSWSAHEKEAAKLLKNLCIRFKEIPIICMEQVENGLFDQTNDIELDRQFEVLYLWTLPREVIRKIVAAYNEAKPIGDEDAVTKRLVSDLEVLNLHRTALNCLTLLKVSEVDFDESPVNRSEMIKRVLFLLFNVDDIPTYKTRPDLKDCEYVLGYFCEQLVRESTYIFSRDKFLLEIQKCCHERLIDLETQVVFDVLYDNNILVKRGNFFCFKFSYWIFYFIAQRMHHEKKFADFIFDEMRYAQQPEIIEFYTGIDRRREDALHILIRDLGACCESIKEKCGLPEGLNPYRFARWEPSVETQAQMQQEIADGVRESNLPVAIKDQYADLSYDKTRPHDQSVSSVLTEHSYKRMVNTMKAGARALRNSDYASPELKRQLLQEILNCWDLVSKVVLIVLPPLAESGYAQYDGSGFVLAGDFGPTPQKRALKILESIPINVVNWYQDDLFSKKMGPLLFDQLENKEISEISKHELILLLLQQRPREWDKHVHRYIASIAKNSFYLADVYRNLRLQYQFGFASSQTLRDIEHLIKMASVKHLTGAKEPSAKTFKKVKFGEGIIPVREVE